MVKRKVNPLKQVRSGVRTGFKIWKSFIGIYKKYFNWTKTFSIFIAGKVRNTTQVNWKEISKYSILVLGSALGVFLFFIFILVAALDVASK